MRCCPASRFFACVAAVGLLGWLATRDSSAQYIQSMELPPGGNGQVSFNLQAGEAYGVLVSVLDPAQLNERGRVEASLGRMRKELHAGDPDWYFTLIPEQPVTVTLRAKSVELDGEVTLDYQLSTLGRAATESARLGDDGRPSWQEAQAIRLDSTIYAAADDRPYIPRSNGPQGVYDQMLEGVDWYKFRYEGPGERLLHLNLEILDRDVPVDVALFTVKDGEPVEYTRGRERFEPEKSTVLHGLYKFAARVIEPGEYYVRVMADHPGYELELATYDPPPYRDPQEAVRVAMDYIVRKGDSWHANVPRRGMSALRTSNVVQETKLCIACHPTHFSTRAEMIAVENGYPVHARESLRFLVERLMNNPRPIYGHTEASWARMIHAPGNVLSRLAYIANKYEQDLTQGERREELYRGIGEFLKLYWPGMQEPQPESNGNLPRISGYEVAHHSALLFRDLHKRHGEERAAEIAAQAEAVAASGEPVDLLDLSWQTVALADLDAEKHREKIAANVQRILELQKPDGSWAMPFGMEIIEYDWRNHEVKRKEIPHRAGQEGPRSSEFQTYHTLYALAKAGVPKDEPHVAKAIAYCLSRQTASGAWQGEPEYKNFDTPFRDTQYAIMALSEYFHGPGKEAAPPAIAAELSPLEKIAALDKVWDPAAPEQAELIRRELNSPHVLVRRYAAIALGRSADPGSIEILAKRLGDPSKLVQRAAAWSLRQVAMRRPAVREEAVEAIRAALGSEKTRVRWGATRLFSQHFKYLSEDWRLGSELIRLAESETVPVVKMQALQGLGQWWFWDRSTEHKAAIEESLIAGLGRVEHPWVRRNFIEGYYNTLDDNLRYLYGSWMERVKLPEDREIVRLGHEASVLGQARRFLAAMRDGSPRTRDGLLRALHTHVLREGQGDVSGLAHAAAPPTVQGPYLNGYKHFALYDPLTGGTGARAGTGNDSDPPKFYSESAPPMNEALTIALETETPQLIDETLKTLDFLAPFPADQRLAVELLSLAGSPETALRKEIAASARKHLPGADIAGPETAERLRAMLADGDAVSVETAAAILAEPRQKALSGDAAIERALAVRLSAAGPEDPAFPHLVHALAASPALRRDAAPALKAVEGLRAAAPASRQAALDFLLSDGKLFEMGKLAKAYAAFLAQASPEALTGALERVQSYSYEKKAHADALGPIERLLTTAMDRDEPAVREAALTAVRTIGPLQDAKPVRERLARLLEDSSPAVRNSAASLDASLAARAGRKGYDTQLLLDYEYFRYNVEPILTTKGADGLACVNCHANHTIFHLREPDEFGVLTHADSRANYSAATGVVNLADPENSLLLNKPTRRLDDRGVGDSQKLTHGGGLRWPTGRDSAEYRTILRWIQGERLGSAAESSED
ncbi:MAG: hypothetical protein GC160_02375 [Acidobacteria bacterium]|nr:hypothetical protein [Acidobacteriota bacterium]